MTAPIVAEPLDPSTWSPLSPWTSESKHPAPIWPDYSVQLWTRDANLVLRMGRRLSGFTEHPTIRGLWLLASFSLPEAAPTWSAKQLWKHLRKTSVAQEIGEYPPHLPDLVTVKLPTAEAGALFLKEASSLAGQLPVSVLPCAGGSVRRRSSLGAGLISNWTRRREVLQWMGDDCPIEHPTIRGLYLAGQFTSMGRTPEEAAQEAMSGDGQRFNTDRKTVVADLVTFNPATEQDEIGFLRAAGLSAEGVPVSVCQL